MDDLFNSLNSVRILFRKAPLIWSALLSEHAQKTAIEQLNNDYSDVVHDFHTQTIAGTRNQSWDTRKSVCLWLNSDGHRSIILSSEIEEVGCAVARNQQSGSLVVCNFEPVMTTTETDFPSICPHLIHFF